MEPISELATRITSHLWILHAIYPDEPSLSVICSRDWRARLESSAAYDWSVLQLLLDLVNDSPEPKPVNAWQRIRHPKASKQQSKTADAIDDREKLAFQAVDGLTQRINIVEEQLPEADLMFAASCPASAFHENKQISPAKLLTREELFQKVANWLLRCQSAKLRAMADAFLGGTEFLVEQEITRCATAIERTTGHPAAQFAREWLGKTKEQRRAVVLHRTAHPDDDKDQVSLRDLCKQLAVPVPFRGSGQTVANPTFGLP